MANRCDEYASIEPFIFHVGTWNVNGRAPSEEAGVALDPRTSRSLGGLRPWLLPTSISDPIIRRQSSSGSGSQLAASISPRKVADFFVIGFQELDQRKEAYMFADSGREREWIQALDDVLRDVCCILEDADSVDEIEPAERYDTAIHARSIITRKFVRTKKLSFRLRFFFIQYEVLSKFSIRRGLHMYILLSIRSRPMKLVFN